MTVGQVRERFECRVHRREVARVATSFDMEPVRACLAANLRYQRPSPCRRDRTRGCRKTTAMRALTQAWRTTGHRVIPLAPSAAAADVLRDELGCRRTENLHKNGANASSLQRRRSPRKPDPSRPLGVAASCESRAGHRT